jgi:predicted transcriptional regulator
VLLSAIAPDEIAPLDDAACAAIRTGVAQAEADDLAPEAEIAALWRRYDL